LKAKKENFADRYRSPPVAASCPPFNLVKTADAQGKKSGRNARPELYSNFIVDCKRD
jgi:hypothetical protein